MEDLLRQTLELIQTTAQEAAGAEGKAAVLNVPQEPKHVYLLVDPKGKATRMEAAPEPRKHTIVMCEEVAEFVTKHGDEKKTVVWFGRDGIVVLLDDETRRDRAELSLSLSPQIRRLMELEKSQLKFEPKAFRRLLRVDFAGCRTDDVLLNWISDCKFSAGSQTFVKLKQASDSFGREVNEAAESSLGECPEEIVLRMRVFDDPSVIEKREIRCAVDVNTDDGTFRLTPLPLQIHDAIEAEVRRIGELLRSTVKCPVFRGKP